MNSKFSIHALLKCATICLTTVLISTSCSKQPTTLKDAFQNYYLFGTAINVRHIRGKLPEDMAIVMREFNTITPENMLKWEKVHPEPDRFNFGPVDSMMAFAEKNGLHVIGHTLIWHSQTPGWVFKYDDGEPATREFLLQRMKHHIETVVDRYKGRILGWDVVNEAIDDNGELRNSKWREIIGDDYIQKAFEYARAADPDAQLYYNDYDMWKPVKRNAVVKLVSELQAQGVKVDGIGLQGHWGMDYPIISLGDSAIAAYAALGVNVLITELDISPLPNPWAFTGADISKRFQLTDETNPWPNGLPDSMQTALADRYAELFELFNKYDKNISRVTFWGVSDGMSWLNNYPIRGRTNYPLLFDRNHQPKRAYYAVLNTVLNK
ncbi:endo-1,4-beta-xylanase [candidate division KSB1 bacterium]|nr:endo-1,4-beta-xylanase [candidate division KSB1 bacterium]